MHGDWLIVWRRPATIQLRATHRSTTPAMLGLRDLVNAKHLKTMVAG